MPLFIPVIIGGAVISVTGWGVKKGYKGITNIKDAKRTVRSAELKYNHHQQILEESRSLLNTHAHDFGVFKLQVASSTIENMLELLKELKRRGKQTPINHLAGIDFEPEQFLVEMKELTGVANELLASLVKGVAKGTLTSAALYGLAGSIGVASTGTAISVLAGAAAKRATPNDQFSMTMSRWGVSSESGAKQSCRILSSPICWCTLENAGRLFLPIPGAATDER